MSFLKKLLPPVLLLLAAIAASGPARAVEQTGQIRGRAIDQQDLPVPGVVMTATSPALQGQITAQTASNGDFRIANLPPGEYRVEATKPGFSTFVAEHLHVSAGATVTVEARMSLAQAGEEIVVEAERPAVDVENTRTGATFNSDMLLDMPSPGRDYQSVIAVTPGVVGGGNANIHGGFDSSNQYYINGVNITDPVTNTFSMNMNYDAIEEVQVITGGMDAEYGRALGGAVNIITKSGGNSFEAQAQLFYSDQRFEIYTPLEGEDPEARQYTDQQYQLNVGGPILKDRLWFFASGQFNLYRDSITFDPAEVGRPTGPDPITGDEMSQVAPRDWRSGYVFGQLTWQPSPTHRVRLHLQSDPTKIVNVRQDPYVLPSAEAIQEQGGWLSSLQDLWMPGPNLSLDTQLYYQTNRIDYYPVLWDGCTNRDDRGACLDDFGTADYPDNWMSYDPNGFDLGEFPYASFNKRQRMSANSSLSWFVYDFLGNHAFKAGVQLEYMKDDEVWPGLEDGIALYASSTGDPSDLSSYDPVMMYQYATDLGVTLTGTMASAYVQDVWTLGRLTLRPGLRLDRTDLRNDVGDSVITSLNLAPRLGAAYDLFGDQRTSVHAYYGRFYDVGFMAVSGLLIKKDQGYSVYGWDSDAGDWNYDSPLYTTFDAFLEHTDIKSPWSDEYNFGLSHALSDSVSVNATWVHQVAHNFWEDDEVNLIWNADGTDVIGYRNGQNVAIYRLRTADDLYTRYDSMELSVEKVYGDNWWLTGSYTWSKATGTSSDQVATATFDIPEQRDYEKGYLDYDTTHSVKVVGSYRNPDVWSVGGASLGYLYGWNFRFSSGQPYRKIYYNAYYQDWYSYESDNSDPYRLPAYSQTDLKAGLMTQLGRTTWALTLECSNVFNDRAVTSVETTWGNETGDGVYLDSNGEPIFGTPLSRQRPRRFTVGLRGEF